MTPFRLILLLGFLAVPPAHAAEQWSTPTETKQWSAPAENQPWSAPAQTQQWSTPTKTEQRSLEHERLSPSLKPEARLVGAWSLRIPTTVTYYSKEADVYRRITPGADMERLVIDASGSYLWGKTKGKLRAIKPWFAQPEIRYFEATHALGRYILYAKSAQELVLLFDVGGVAASGSRLR